MNPVWGLARRATISRGGGEGGIFLSGKIATEGWGRERERVFFFEKKNQKTFGLGGVGDGIAVNRNPRWRLLAIPVPAPRDKSSFLRASLGLLETKLNTDLTE
jgi:hypothetical protein